MLILFPFLIYLASLALARSPPLHLAAGVIRADAAAATTAVALRRRSPRRLSAHVQVDSSKTLSDSLQQRADPISSLTVQGSTWTSIGCADDTKRMLTGFHLELSANSPAACIAECTKRGYKYAGVEYWNECYCGQSLSSALTARSDCSAACPGDSAFTCGGTYQINLWQQAANVPIATIVSGGVTWNSLGCADDSTRMLAIQLSDNNQNSPAVCIAACQAQGYTYAGMEYSHQCFCGSALQSSLVARTDCSTACPGDSSAICGGSYRINLWQRAALPATSTTISATPSSTAAAPSATATVSGTQWNSLGCADDSKRMLGTQLSDNNQNSPASCIAACQARGFSYAGLEYSTQCFCGSSLQSTLVAKTGCSTRCPGDSSAFCGGSYLINLWQSTSTSGGSGGPTSGPGGCPASGSFKPTLTAPSSGSTKFIFSHHMVGNTFPYSSNDWLDDVNKAYSSGVDAFALNIGTASWELDQVRTAYDAASSQGKGFKMFYSFDMSIWSCSTIANQMVDYIAAVANHPSQFKYNGRVLVTTFSGESCGDGAWVDLRNRLNSKGIQMHFVPGFFSGTSWSGWQSIDGEINWNSAWSANAGPIQTDTDYQYLSVLGGKSYMPTISPLFFTHYGVNSYNKNWIYMSDDWPLARRWEQLISLRDRFDMMEQLTWNDYGESHYMGPIKGQQPNSQAWVDGFDHQVFLQVNTYYSQAFKTGSYPTIVCDKIYLMARPHTNTAVATADTVGSPPVLGQFGASGSAQATAEAFFALIFATAPGKAVLSSGSSSQSFDINAGINSIRAPLIPGQGMRATLTRSGTTYIDFAPSFTFATTTREYNFNYAVFASS